MDSIQTPKPNNSDRIDHFANNHPVFGDALDISQLSVDKLPTKLQVLNIVRGLMRKHQKPSSGFVDRQDKILVYKHVFQELSKIWKCVFIPVPSLDNGWKGLDAFVEASIAHVRKSPKETQENKDKFMKHLNSLYSLSKCKCYINFKNENIVKTIQEFESKRCYCKQKDKILCRNFYQDQMFGRILTMDLIPVGDMARYQQKYEGKYIFC